MQIMDLTQGYEPLYLSCLRDWRGNPEAGNHKERWYRKMIERGLRVKLAADDEGEVGGMIQYLPVEQSLAEGRDLYVIQCFWVHQEGDRGDFHRQGMGAALLKAAEDEARALGAKGIAGWGMDYPYWLPVSWLKKHIYAQADQVGLETLVWKPFSHDAIPPKLIRRKKTPVAMPGKVTVTAFVNGWCQVFCGNGERAKKVVSEFDDAVLFRAIDTSDRDVFLEWGIHDALFIDNEEVNPTGPPPNGEHIGRLIQERLAKL